LVDGQSPTPESRLALPDGHPINWDISPDGKTLYCLPMTANQLYSYDLTAEGDTLHAKSLGALLPDATAVDCRAICVGPQGDVGAAITGTWPTVRTLHHIVHYKPGSKAPRDLGPVAIGNPDYTPFVDAEGKPLPFHHGMQKMADGTTTTKHVILGVSQGSNGKV